MLTELPFMFALLGVSLAVMGAVFVRRQARFRHLGQQAVAHWLSTTGRVLSSQMGGHWSEMTDSTAYLNEAQIRYEYTVNGQVYQSRNVTLQDTSTSSLQPQQEILARYPVGQLVTVHYDPQQPGHSALELRQGSGSWVFTLVGWFFIVGGVGFTLFGLLFFALVGRLMSAPP